MVLYANSTMVRPDSKATTDNTDNTDTRDGERYRHRHDNDRHSTDFVLYGRRHTYHRPPTDRADRLSVIIVPGSHLQ